MSIYCKNLRWKITTESATSVRVESEPVWPGRAAGSADSKESRAIESQAACIHFITGLVGMLQERLGNMQQLLDVFTAQSASTELATQRPTPSSAVVGNSLSHGLLLTLRYAIEESTIQASSCMKAISTIYCLSLCSNFAACTELVRRSMARLLASGFAAGDGGTAPLDASRRR